MPKIVDINAFVRKKTYDQGTEADKFDFEVRLRRVRERHIKEINKRNDTFNKKES